MINALRKLKTTDEEKFILAVYGLGIVVGVGATLWLKKTKVVVSADTVLAAWHKGITSGGKHVYLLTAAQKELWEECWAAAQKTAQETMIQNPDYLRGLAEGTRRTIAMVG